MKQLCVHKEASCTCIGASLATIGLLTCVVIWLVYSIMAVLHHSYYEITKICPDTTLWIVLIVQMTASLLFNGTIRTIVKYEGNKKTEIITENPLSALMLGVYIWSWIVIEDECVKNKLRDNSVYELAMYWIYFMTVMSGIIVIVMIVTCIYSCKSMCENH